VLPFLKITIKNDETNPLIYFIIVYFLFIPLSVYSHNLISYSETKPELEIYRTNILLWWNDTYTNDWTNKWDLYWAATWLSHFSSLLVLYINSTDIVSASYYVLLLTRTGDFIRFVIQYFILSILLMKLTIFRKKQFVVIHILHLLL
jgi:hypothetical protein